MKIMTFVDGSSYSASVCDHTIWAAKRMELPVEIYHVIGRREPSSIPADLSGSLNLGARSDLLEKLAASDAERAKLTHARGRLILETASERMRAAGIERIDERLRNEDIVQTITRFEEESRAIVVGKRGEASSQAHDHIGSNLERILRVATRPVLIANRAFQPIERYLIAFDGSRSVMNSVERISTGTLLKGLHCRLLHVGSETPAMREKMEGARALLLKNASDVTIEFRQGDPEKTIAEAVEGGGADLLVIGAYGHRRLRRLFLGSTSATMAHMCKVPVMIFR